MTVAGQQATRPLSSGEAEYAEMTNGAANGISTKNLLDEMGLELQLICEGEVKCRKVPTAYNVGDLQTKPPDPKKHHELPTLLSTALRVKSTTRPAKGSARSDVAGRSSLSEFSVILATRYADDWSQVLFRHSRTSDARSLKPPRRAHHSRNRSDIGQPCEDICGYNAQLRAPLRANAEILDSPSGINPSVNKGGRSEGCLA